MCGLDPDRMNMIIEVLANHSEVSGAIIFGSRAKGCYNDYSDIDIALEGEISPLLAQRIASELEDLPFPQQFDVKALASIESQPLLDHIARVGVRIFPPNS